MKECLLGIDIGTSACKVAAFMADGECVSQVSKPYPTVYPHPGWAEQDPARWWEAVCEAVRELVTEHGINPCAVLGIGVAGQSGSAVAVDGKGETLCNTPIWMDTRAAGLCAEYEQRLGRERIFAVSGNCLRPSYTLPKVLWYQRERPEVYRKTDKILQSNSFIVCRLTGEMTQDLSQGYGWQCYDSRSGRWDYELLADFGIRPSLLPELRACHGLVGTVTREAARLTGLAEGTPVVAGGLDAACGTLGVGVIHDGETQEQGGQAGGMSICMDRCKSSEKLILSSHVVPGRWLLQGGTVGGGGVARWLEEELCHMERELAGRNGTTALQEMDREAGRVSAGSDGLVFLPYMAGERSPLWDPCAKGVFFGLDFSKTRAHMIRACFEGVAFSLLHNLDTAREAGVEVAAFSSMGGAANSRLWTQIKSDVVGKPIRVPDSDMATALGAAMLAGVGIGMSRSFEESVRRMVRIRREYLPNRKNYERYQQTYQIYLELYERLRETMQSCGGMEENLL